MSSNCHARRIRRRPGTRHTDPVSESVTGSRPSSCTRGALGKKRGRQRLGQRPRRRTMLRGSARRGPAVAKVSAVSRLSAVTVRARERGPCGLDANVPRSPLRERLHFVLLFLCAGAWIGPRRGVRSRRRGSGRGPRSSRISRCRAASRPTLRDRALQGFRRHQQSRALAASRGVTAALTSCGRVGHSAASSPSP